MNYRGTKFLPPTWHLLISSPIRRICNIQNKLFVFLRVSFSFGSGKHVTTFVSKTPEIPIIPPKFSLFYLNTCKLYRLFNVKIWCIHKFFITIIAINIFIISQKSFFITFLCANANLFGTVIQFQVFLSNSNNLWAIIEFQVFLSNSNNLQTYMVSNN